MSVIIAAVSLFAMPVPAWIVLVAIVGLYVVQYVTITRRVESHARCLGHLDRWANSVEARLDVVGQALGHAPGERLAKPANRPRKDKRSMTSDQVTALLERIVRRAA
jgi:hypothetical protein